MAQEKSIQEMQAIYDMVKAFYFSGLKGKDRETWRQKLYDRFRTNKGSSNIFYYVFRAMYEGKEYKYGIDPPLRDYMLSQMQIEFGDEVLSRALASYKYYIEHYMETQNTPCHKEWEIYDKYIRTLQQEHQLVVDLSSEDLGYEGERKEVCSQKIERSRKVRELCVKYKGTICTVCGFDFEKTYGKLGKGFIHIHHINPLSCSQGTHRVDVMRDLVPVCPNCHAMLHRDSNSTMDIEELKQLIECRYE